MMLPMFSGHAVLIVSLCYGVSRSVVGQSSHAEEADQYYQEASALINAAGSKQQQDSSRERIVALISKAADLNHSEALETMASGLLFGTHFAQNVSLARQMLQMLSNNGSVTAQTLLGFMHSVGLGVDSSQAAAVVFYTFAALGRNPWAQMALGYRFYYGINVPQSCETALIYYEQVANEVANGISYGIGTAMHRFRLMDDVEDPNSGSNTNNLIEENLLQYYKFLADKGDVSAQLGLGQLFLTGGRGVDQNFDQARNYLNMAADAGISNAWGLLGKMFLEGTSATPADNLTAFQYFKRSADKGSAVGQSGLAYMYLKGLGVQLDYAKAFKLFLASAEQDSVEAQLHLGLMYYKGLGVDKNYAMALKYFQLASQAGSVLGMYHLAQMHSLGLGVLRACHTAVEFFKNVAERGKWSSMLMQAYADYKDSAGRGLQAALVKYLFLADLGYEIAQSNAAYILDKGDVHFDDAEHSEEERLQQAFVLWERAAIQGCGYARLKVADCHYYGKGTPVDYEEAIGHYKLASELQRVPQAMFNLGYMHEQGIGIERDLHLAKRFYDMAIEVNPDAALPVNLALLKLSFLFAADFFQQSWWKLDFIDRAFGPHWDYYAIPIMCAIVAGLFTLRRQQHHQR